MGKTKQKLVETLQDFFLTRKNLNFEEIDWKYIFSWMNTLDLNQELESLAITFHVKSICIYDGSGKRIGNFGESNNWEKMVNSFSLYGERWVKSGEENSIQYGVRISGNSGEYYHCLLSFNKTNFRVENCNMIAQVLKLLSVAISDNIKTEDKIIPFMPNHHPFPVVEEGKIHVLRCTNLNHHLPSIKQALNQLGMKPKMMAAGDIKMEFEEPELVQIVSNIQNWEHLQLDFVNRYFSAVENGFKPTILLCFDADPFYLFQKGKLLENIHRLITSLPVHEYSMEPIIESSLDENKLLEIIDTVWSGEDKLSA